MRRSFIKTTLLALTLLLGLASCGGRDAAVAGGSDGGGIATCRERWIDGKACSTEGDECSYQTCGSVEDESSFCTCTDNRWYCIHPNCWTLPDTTEWTFSDAGVPNG